MKYQIPNCYTGAIIHEGDYATMADCIAAAIVKGANLGGANLVAAKLAGAYLREANLARAKITESQLRDIAAGLSIIVEEGK